MGKHREGIGVTSLAFFSKTSTTKWQWQWHWNAMNWGNKIFFNERSLICTDFILLQVFLFLQGISLHWNAMVCGNKITLNEKSKIVKIFFLTNLSFSIVLFESLTPLKNTVKNSGFESHNDLPVYYELQVNLWIIFCILNSWVA